MDELSTGPEFGPSPTSDMLDIFGYEADIPARVLSAITEAIMSDELLATELQKLLQQGTPLDTALTALQLQSDKLVGIPSTEADVGQHHMETLGITERTGLALTHEPDFGVTLTTIRDLPTFYASLRRVVMPDDPISAQTLTLGLRYLIDNSLRRVCIVTERLDPEAYLRALGEKPRPDWLELNQKSKDLTSIFFDNDINFSATLPAYASEVAKELERLGVNHENWMLRQLTIANNEGLLTEWAAAYYIGIFDSRAIGLRLSSTAQWQRIYALLAHMAGIAPGATLTNHIRQSLLTEIDQFLKDPVYPPEWNPRDSENSRQNLLLAQRTIPRILPDTPPPPLAHSLTSAGELGDEVERVLKGDVEEESWVALSGLREHFTRIDETLGYIRLKLNDILTVLKKIIDGLQRE